MMEVRKCAFGPAVKSWEDLRGKTVIVLRGYSYGGWISKIQDSSTGIKALEVDDHAQAPKAEKLLRDLEAAFEGLNEGEAVF